MPASSIAILIALFFVTSVFGVVTGSNSLITVPVMFELGMDEKRAVATNMFGLTFMAIGGAIPFLRQGKVNVRSLSPMIILTIVGSAIGAAVVGLVTGQTIKVIVTVAMFAVVIFTILKPNPQQKGDAKGNQIEEPPEALKGSGLGYALVFFLAIYGGLYSGGYVTVLTATLVAFFGMSFAGSIAATKVVNIFSSSVATAVFIYQGLVDFTLGIILGVTMFAGAYLGAHIAVRLNERVLQFIFYFAVLLIAVKMLFDLLSVS